MPVVSIGFFRNSHHYNNANITNFILAVGTASLEEEGGLRRWGEASVAGGHVSGVHGWTIRKKLDKWNLQPWNVIRLLQLISNFIFTSIICCKETTNIWEYKGNFARLWKTRICSKSSSIFTFLSKSWYVLHDVSGDRSSPFVELRCEN